MLEKMFLIVFAITIWEYRDPITNSIFSCILIILSYFSNLVYEAKTRMRIRKARKKREAEKEESIEEPADSATLMQEWENEHKKDKSTVIKSMMKRWWPDDS